MTRGKHRPETVAARNTDPETSHEAADRLSVSATEWYRRAIASTIQVASGPLTSTEVAHIRGWTYEADSTYWKRQSELLEWGYLQVIEQHMGPKGRWQDASELTEKGHERLNSGGKFTK